MKIDTNIVLSTANTIIWSAVVVTLGIVIYHHYYYKHHIVGTVDLDHIVTTKMASLAVEGRNNNTPEAEVILEGAQFAKELTKVSKQTAKEYNLVLLPKKSVIYGENVDMTKIIKEKLGMPEEQKDLFNVLKETN
jgi:hypothetical protein